MMKPLSLVLLLAFLRSSAVARPIPQRGWRSWQAVAGEVNQSLMMKFMAGLAKKRPLGAGGALESLADHGYVDVGLDSGYFLQDGVDGSCHDKSGRMVMNYDAFPSMNNMTSYAHSLNLTASWYLNCDGCPGNIEKKAFPAGTYTTDSQSAVAYGFDGVKFDSQSGGPSHNITDWEIALNSTGKHMTIENCLDKHPAYLLTDPATCPFDFYRAGPDNAPHFFGAVSKVYHWLNDFLGVFVDGVAASRPGCYAYADMLSIGTPVKGFKIYTEATSRGCANMTLKEERTVFSLWCIVSSPLILGFDVADDDVVAKYWPIVTNDVALGVNEAWAGEAGRLLKQAPPSDPSNINHQTTFVGTSCEENVTKNFPAWFVYSKALDTSGAIAVLAVRFGPVDGSNTLSVSLAELVASNAGPNTTTSFTGVNVWDASAPGVTVDANAPWTPTVGVHDSQFYIFKPSS